MGYPMSVDEKNQINELFQYRESLRSEIRRMEMQVDAKMREYRHLSNRQIAIKFNRSDSIICGMAKRYLDRMVKVVAGER